MAALLLSSMSTKETLPCMILKAYVRAATITNNQSTPFFIAQVQHSLVHEESQDNISPT